jgi:hypothetical protein
LELPNIAPRTSGVSFPAGQAAAARKNCVAKVASPDPTVAMAALDSFRRQFALPFADALGWWHNRTQASAKGRVGLNGSKQAAM